MFDFAVIGAGICGALIARCLTSYGKKVCVIEKEADVAMGTTKANSAIVHAGFDAAEGSLKARLNVRGAELMEGLAEELGVKYRRCGALVCAFDETDRSTLEKLLERGRINGVKDLKIVGQAELRQMEPEIGEDVVCALYAPSSAIVCPYELCIAAMGSAMDNGAKLLLNTEVTGIEKADGCYRILYEGGSLSAAGVINCAGLFADRIAAMAGDSSFTIRPRKGEYMVLDKECGGLAQHTVFRCPSAMGKGILVTPTVDGNLLVGPTAEDTDDKLDTSTEVSSAESLKKNALQQIRGIPFGKIIASFAGLRAVGTTGDFIINEPVPGFVNVAAIESPGLSSAPAIAEYVCDMLRSDGFCLEKDAAFVPARRSVHWFRELADEEKNAVIAEHPEFGHIVCRCEGISEGEILEALRRNPAASDLDGVKRRTRAGMGRCQGGFCSPTAAELIAREKGTGLIRVTKFGGASAINVGMTKEL